ALPYEAPTQVVILIFLSFLIFVNAARRLFARIVGAGLLGEVIVGAIYGAPLASILPSSAQHAILAFGYLGLLLLVVGGGLETRLDILTQHLFVVFMTAAIGVGLPIGFSLALLPSAFGFNVLEAFACGAALASTSLGTVFSVIGSISSEEDHNSASIIDTRAGSTLIGAALIDDIVGLVLSSIIVSLSSSTSQIAPWSIARPIVSSTVFLIVVALLSRFVVGLALSARQGRLAHSIRQGLDHIRNKHPSFWTQYGLESATIVFVVVVAGSASVANYIGSSNLIGAFSAGAFMATSWTMFQRQLNADDTSTYGDNASTAETGITLISPNATFGFLEKSFGRYVLVPFFFASIGFAIPVKEMFSGEIVWKGFVYSGLMGLAKMLAGSPILVAEAVARLKRRRNFKKTGQSVPGEEAGAKENSRVEMAAASEEEKAEAAWPAALFVGSALVARGEIGFLIVNLAYQGGLLSSEAFLVATWAITLNTIVGPACVGILLR
ncbi:Sodium/hydrogen exchanger, partial [Acaromyces ingoldii]